MKKLLLTICSSLFCVLSYAQTEHLTFKGLPIDGSKQEFVNTVWQVGVLFKSTYDTWSLIKRIYDDLVDVYTKKYGAPILDQKEFKSPWREGDGHELFALRSDRCVYRTVFVYIKDRMDIGCVEIRMANDCRIIILYEDSINSDLLTKERANEI